MPTYALLTRLTPESAKSPGELKTLEKTANERIRKECPQVKWLGNYAVLGPFDYLDVFEAPDETVAAKVAIIIRSVGRAQTETWALVPWERFEQAMAA